MRHHRRRTTAALLLLAVVGSIAGLVIESAAGHEGSTAAAATAEAPPLRAAVTAEGAPVGAPLGWRVQHVDRGRYRLEFDRDVQLSIASWELPATVVVRPIAVHTWQVDIVDGHRAVDSAFSFTAAAP
ncbi:MAG: hypothetical protein QOD30_1546 [Actinomycetota bacterium]|jgi:hypothetical protein|nr:hypothetical protein [Actinomycetota bacterium]